MRVVAITAREPHRPVALAATGMAHPVPSLLAALPVLVKARVGALITFTAVVGALVASRGSLAPAALGWLVASVGLTCAGAGCLNHYLDRDLDARMERTRRRPLPAGAVRRLWTVPLAGGVLVSVGLLAAWRHLNTSVAMYGLAGAVVYVGVYTLWLKRRTPWNIVVGGLAGSAAVLAGGAAAPGGPDLPVVGLAAAVFLWTPPHFWSLAIAYEDDYRRAGIPMLPVVVGRHRTARAIVLSTWLLLATTLLLAWPPLRWPVGVVALTGGGLLVWANLRLLRQPTPEAARRSFHISNLYLFLVFLAAALSVVS